MVSKGQFYGSVIKHLTDFFVFRLVKDGMLLICGMGNGKNKIGYFLFSIYHSPSPFRNLRFSNIRKRSVTGNFELSVTMHFFRVFSDRHDLSISFYVDLPKS